jgi:K+/H+ antiporter YhaU regulatory subunit KhtT
MRASTRDRIRYRIDTFLAGGTTPLLAVLAASFLAALASIALVRVLLGLLIEDPISLGKHTWIVFLQMTDPGNMNQDNDTPHLFRFGAVPAGFVGVVIFSSLIAVLTTVLNEAIGRFRKGHSKVVEDHHTVIVGWGNRVPEMLRELAIANESRSDAVVAILADENKEVMDEHLRVAFADRRSTRVVTRHGSGSSLASLDQVNASAARAIVVLARASSSSSAEEKLASDSQAIKTVLALDVTLRDRDTPIVVEAFDPYNRLVVQELSKRRIVAVDAADMLSRIIVQTSRTSGLAWVYSELLSFQGAELYLHRPQVRGARFGELLFQMQNAVPIGIVHADSTVHLRPSSETVVPEDGWLVVVGHDDSMIGVLPKPRAVPEVPAPPAREAPRRTERMLLLGWSPTAPVIVREYAKYVLAGSPVDVVVREPSQAVREAVQQVAAAIPELKLRLVEGNVMLRAELGTLEPTTYDTVIVLRQRPLEDIAAERIDAESILVLLHLRELVRAARARGTTVQTRIVTEVLDSSNQDLMTHAGANDFIVSDRLVSMILAQLAEEPRLQQVYDELFRESGSEIYVKPAEAYFASLPVTTSLAALMAIAQKRGGEICIGYRRGELAEDPRSNFGMVLNPAYEETIEIREGDALVVVAENDQ